MIKLLSAAVLSMGLALSPTTASAHAEIIDFGRYWKIHNTDSNLWLYCRITNSAGLYLDIKIKPNGNSEKIYGWWHFKCRH